MKMSEKNTIWLENHHRSNSANNNNEINNNTNNNMGNNINNNRDQVVIPIGPINNNPIKGAILMTIIGNNITNRW
jgi:hypothetical protein